MSDFVPVTKDDARYQTLKKGFNLRWPQVGDDGARMIYVCKTAAEVEAAANDALAKGYRLTVRSGGHCYEGFVSNALTKAQPGVKPLAIIDLGLMSGMQYDKHGKIAPHKSNATYKFRIASGSQNWDGYAALYKLSDKTIPAGSCYSVGAGGHICGGGYGLLSRKHGLTVDWLSAVDILVPSTNGTSVVLKTVERTSTGDDLALFTACCGGGGGNYGIITNYYFADLPEAPREAYWLVLEFPWEQWDQVGKDQFGTFLQAYWQWFSDHDSDWNSLDPAKANGGLFVLGKFNHRSTGSVALAIQYTGSDGTANPANSQPLVNFVNTMTQAAGFTPLIGDTFLLPNLAPLRHPRAGLELRVKAPLDDALHMDWLYLTQMLNGSGNNQRGKYKSSYQVGNFGETEIDALWNNLNNDDTAQTQSLVQIDSYGGAINAAPAPVTGASSVYQRKSLLKAQYQTYWALPTKDESIAAEIEALHVDWIRTFYSAVFADQGGKPYADSTGRYEGCYINYPDVDMKYIDDAHKTVDPRWLELYYGDKLDNLIKAKQAFDPKNIFFHEMSIPLVKPGK
ncbi:BBE domain-containing protein [Collimonas sp.]|jgi:FAD/FMN-containing dehydrogenase|uniref:BBE domain-containing protein n=1 Tax=Collimonas sp. TaxID=1963772 RepID=UPI002CC91BB6|nr:BBE domain-containing protein [Collimonas sp.]HWW05557.1 BBE domain-containing protein [Collimonas sp.]